MAKPTTLLLFLLALLLSRCAEQPLPLPAEPLIESPRLDSTTFLRNAAVAYFNEGAKIHAAYAQMWDAVERSGQKPVGAEYRTRSEACTYFAKAQEINALLPDTLQLWYVRDAAQRCVPNAAADSIGENEQLRNELARLQSDIVRKREAMEERFRQMQDSLRRQNSSETVVSEVRQYYPEVYRIKANKLIVTVDGETETVDEYSMFGTGFMLSDGSFVTARHIVEPWYFLDRNNLDTLDVLLNLIVNKGGTVKVDYTAYSSSGKEINFSSTNFRVDRRNDEKHALTVPESGDSAIISYAKYYDGSDWAVWRKGGSSDIVADYSLSTTLPSGTKLYMLGFPIGITGENVEPILSECKTAMAGLRKGIILVNGDGIESGNSGGPVFYYSNNRYTVVGIVSVRAGSLGYLVPIANIR